ncbi:hypothetical protein ASD97_25870 [Streptomyces sp. Root63]|nr:hypothetical protein ASD29_32175 [Streptomyces sp. Root1295]KRA34067.1 hypothetical protein ASD97_25870 [Streptomyces sp. Root63]
MNDTWEFWLVEQHVDLGNESFWHEKARLLRRPFQSEAKMEESCHMVGNRDVLKYGGQYRIRVIKEQTVFDSEGVQ